MSANLYDITSELADIQDAVFNTDEEVPVETLEALNSTSLSMEEKIGGCCRVLSNMTGHINSVDTEIKRLTAKKKALANNQDRLKTAVKEGMERVDLKKLKLPCFSLSVVDGREKVDVWDEKLIPAEYKEEVITFKVDKTSIKKAGGCAGAKVIRGDSFLTIR